MIFISLPGFPLHSNSCCCRKTKTHNQKWLKEWVPKSPQPVLVKFLNRNCPSLPTNIRHSHVFITVENLAIFSKLTICANTCTEWLNNSLLIFWRSLITVLNCAGLNFFTSLFKFLQCFVKYISDAYFYHKLPFFFHLLFLKFQSCFLHSLCYWHCLSLPAMQNFTQFFSLSRSWLTGHFLPSTTWRVGSSSSTS